MFWATVSGVAFVLLMAIVIVIARSATAQWERDKRADRAPRRERAAAPEPDGWLSWAHERTSDVAVRSRAVLRTVTTTGRRRLARASGVATAARHTLTRWHPVDHLPRLPHRRRSALPSAGAPASSSGAAAADTSARIARRDTRRGGRRLRRRIAAGLVGRRGRGRRPQAPGTGPRT
jgi:hypothetical protein